MVARARLLGRFAPNRRKGAGRGQRAVRLQRLMTDPDLRAGLNMETMVKLASLRPGTTRTVDDKTTVPTEQDLVDCGKSGASY